MNSNLYLNLFIIITMLAYHHPLVYYLWQLMLKGLGLEIKKRRISAPFHAPQTSFLPSKVKYFTKKIIKLMCEIRVDCRLSSGECLNAQFTRHRFTVDFMEVLKFKRISIKFAYDIPIEIKSLKVVVHHLVCIWLVVCVRIGPSLSTRK